jgi:bifunctional ADP-heptose synthase (sugar kinase/adenylyltransferase)
VIAVLALAQASGMPLAEGCRLAAHAAALSVRVMGNYAPTRQELEKSLGE